MNPWEILSRRAEARSRLAEQIRTYRNLRRSEDGVRLLTNDTIRLVLAGKFAKIEDAPVRLSTIRKNLINFIESAPDAYAWAHDPSLPCGEDDYRGEVYNARNQQFLEEFQVYLALVAEEYNRGR
jgi:hypothetical protein